MQDSNTKTVFIPLNMVKVGDRVSVPGRSLGESNASGFIFVEVISIDPEESDFSEFLYAKLRGYEGFHRIYGLDCVQMKPIEGVEPTTVPFYLLAQGDWVYTVCRQWLQGKQFMIRHGIHLVETFDFLRYRPEVTTLLEVQVAGKVKPMADPVDLSQYHTRGETFNGFHIG